MNIKDVTLEISAVRISQYPNINKPEFLLVGRSNVGKSSFINTIINKKNFARTSGKPGKTQTLNFYFVNKEFFIVDVPGYGYAEVSKAIHKKFGLMIEEYLQNREQLKHVFMLVDMRHKPTEDDVLMYNYLKYTNVPVTIVATKADKVNNSQLAKHQALILDTLDLVVGDELVQFSSITKKGTSEIIKTMSNYLK